MNPLVLLLALATFVSTLIGGLLAIRLRKVIHYFFAFSAGSLISVAFLDLLPESVSTSQLVGMPIRFVFLAVVFSFLFYSAVEKVFATHHLHADEGHGHIMGPIGAGSLVIHSFLDGAAIGAAFQLSAIAGLIVALAVISHDFTDGINTVTIMLKNGHVVKKAKLFLVADAVAPILGVLATSAIIISHAALALILAVFVGEFVYLGASNMLPETRKHTAWKMILFIAAGVLVIAALTSLI